jgi:hypothetical protein
MQRLPGTRKGALRGPEGVTFPASSSRTGPSGSRIHEERSQKPYFAPNFRHISGLRAVSPRNVTALRRNVTSLRQLPLETLPPGTHLGRPAPTPNPAAGAR